MGGNEPNHFAIHAGAVAVAVVALAALPMHPGPVESVKYHAWLAADLLGWVRHTAVGRVESSPLVPRAGQEIEEMRGLPSAASFLESFLGRAPAIMRQAATRRHGFNLSCLQSEREGGQTLQQALASWLGNRTLTGLRSSWDDASVDRFSVEEYARLAMEASQSNGSKAPPAVTGLPLAEFGTCAEIAPATWVRDYHGPTGFLHQRNVFAAPAGASIKMHMDVSSTFTLQVFGRTRWFLVDRKHAPEMRVYGDAFNMAYIPSVDLRYDHAPEGVAVQELVVHPGDILYIPPFTLHMAYFMDEDTLWIDDMTISPTMAMSRHWMLTCATLFNPVALWHLFLQVWNTGSDNAFDLYISRVKALKAAEVVPREVSRRAAIFFMSIFVMLLHALLTYYRTGERLTRMLFCHRIYQAFGHAAYAFGVGNYFTRASAIEGWGLLNDSTGFLVEGLIFRHRPLLLWGCMHFGHRIAMTMVPELFTKMVAAKGLVFWSNLLLDNFFNILALRFLYMKVNAQSMVQEPEEPQRGMHRARSEPAMPMSPTLHAKAIEPLMRKRSGAHGSSWAFLASFVVALLWTILNS